VPNFFPDPTKMYGPTLDPSKTAERHTKAHDPTTVLSDPILLIPDHAYLVITVIIIEMALQFLSLTTFTRSSSRHVFKA